MEFCKVIGGPADLTWYQRVDRELDLDLVDKTAQHEEVMGMVEEYRAHVAAAARCNLDADDADVHAGNARGILKTYRSQLKNLAAYIAGTDMGKKLAVLSELAPYKYSVTGQAELAAMERRVATVIRKDLIDRITDLELQVERHTARMEAKLAERDRARQFAAALIANEMVAAIVAAQDSPAEQQPAEKVMAKPAIAFEVARIRAPRAQVAKLIAAEQRVQAYAEHLGINFDNIRSSIGPNGDAYVQLDIPGKGWSLAVKPFENGRQVERLEILDALA